MSFDPEKVTTYSHSVFGGYAPFVTKEDYDQLLELYRAMTAKMDELPPNGILDHEAVQ